MRRPLSLWSALFGPAKVNARAEVSADWRLGTAAERHQQRLGALAVSVAQSNYQAPRTTGRCHAFG